ncbi:hypothetical protein I4U23_002291 [Adineta vaga]|nr:hypothetical protein I4U23_002291 [Adineta vaga]
MSKTAMRNKPPRDVYYQQSPYHKTRKRKSSGSLYSYDDSDIAYRSAPQYLKRLLNTSNSSNGYSARSLTRTHSASEVSTQNNINRQSNIGNPKYKAQEDYYDEIQLLKKELKYSKEDNNNLRAKIRRLEEDNSRKCKEIDNLYDPNKNEDLRRTLAGSSAPNANIVMNLKQRIFKLELQLKQRETIIDEMKNDLRWTRSTELEIQNRALFNELEKHKLERLNLLQNNYAVCLDEETKHAIRKLEVDKRDLKTENEYLKKRVDELEQIENNIQSSSSRKHNGNTDRHRLEKVEELKERCTHYEDELEQIKDDLKQMRRERDKYRDKFDNINEDLEEVKRDRNRHISYSSTTGIRRRNSSSSEDRSKHDLRSNLSLRKPSEQFNSRTSLTKFDRKISSTSMSRKSLSTSSRNLRRYEWTSDDDYRVKYFRENRAATIIQRGWRKHKRTRKHSFMNKSKQDIFDRRNSKINGMRSSAIQSPRGSQQKLGSKIDNFGSSISKSRSSSTNLTNESALKIVQASLRGYIDRTNIDQFSRRKPSHHSGSDDDDDIFPTSSKQFVSSYNSERKRASFHSNMDNFHDKHGSNNRLPASEHRPLKQSSLNNQNKFGLENRFSLKDQDMSVTGRLSSSPRVGHINGSKQSLFDNKDKFNSANHFDRESSLKIRRSISPSNDRGLPHDNIRAMSHESNISIRKSSRNSKQSLTNIHNDDDDDVLGF